jgi:hypothetical protein
MKQLTNPAAGIALRVAFAGAFILVYAQPLPAEEPPAVCKTFKIDDTGSQPLHAATASKDCKTGKRMGFPVPDPKCTPGAINPTVTAAVLRDPKFRTECVRGDITSEEKKETTYDAYGLAHPKQNAGPTQSCELDHLVPLELGGADSLENIWPQCGPAGVMLSARYFKEKDKVEDYLAMMVRMGRMELGAAQQGIVADWTQYLEAARKNCLGGMCGK